MIFEDYISGLVDKYKSWKNKRFVTSVMNDNRALFSYFGKDIYASDIVNNCIDRIATEISKINVMSVVESADRVAVQNDDITRLFRFKPNPLQTTKDFLASLVWLQRKDMHCFVYPAWEDVIGRDGRSYRRYTALWPLNPTSVELGRSEDGEWLIKFYWKNGSNDILPYSDVIHMKWRRGKNLIVGGGNDDGIPDTRDSYSAVTILDKILQGIPLTVESSLKMNGLFTSRTKLDADRIAAARDEFEKRIMTSSMGIAAIDIAGDFTPIGRSPVSVPDSTMAFVKGIIQQRYGVSPAILEGCYNDEAHASFYQTCIEDFIEDFQQAFSAVLFTRREQDIGHRVKCYYSKVEYYSTASKIQLAQIARETGIMTLNQINAMFGLEPFEQGDRRVQSLNFVNMDLVDKYQMKNLQAGAQAQGVETEGQPPDENAGQNPTENSLEL